MIAVAGDGVAIAQVGQRKDQMTRTRGHQGQQRQRVDKAAIGLRVAVATLSAVAEARQQGYRAPQVGGGAEAIRVVRDHSRAGDSAYFGPGACGPPLKVSGCALTFTPSGGESPMVIPAEAIVEINMNASTGANIGGFHLVTSKGFYLRVAPPSGRAAEGRGWSTRSTCN